MSQADLVRRYFTEEFFPQMDAAYQHLKTNMSEQATQFARMVDRAERAEKLATWRMTFDDSKGMSATFKEISDEGRGENTMTKPFTEWTDDALVREWIEACEIARGGGALDEAELKRAEQRQLDIECEWNRREKKQMADSLTSYLENETQKRHGSSGMCCLLRLQEKARAEVAELQRDANKQAVFTAIDQYELLRKRLDEAESSLEFYRSRCNVLQCAQLHFREPERTTVCNILANGKAAP